MASELKPILTLKAQELDFKTLLDVFHELGIVTSHETQRMLHSIDLNLLEELDLYSVTECDVLDDPGEGESLEARAEAISNIMKATYTQQDWHRRVKDKLDLDPCPPAVGPLFLLYHAFKVSETLYPISMLPIASKDQPDKHVVFTILREDGRMVLSTEDPYLIPPDDAFEDVDGWIFCKRKT